MVRNVDKKILVCRKFSQYFLVKSIRKARICKEYLRFCLRGTVPQLLFLSIFYKEPCRRLWCVKMIGKRKGCSTHHMPWADGTPCAKRKVNSPNLPSQISVCASIESLIFHHYNITSLIMILILTSCLPYKVLLVTERRLYMPIYMLIYFGIFPSLRNKFCLLWSTQHFKFANLDVDDL